MKPLRMFNEFVKKGIMRKKTPDFSRASSLIEEAERRKNFLTEISNKIEMSDENANYFIENVYDIVMELIRAKLFMDGFKSSGEWAHEAEVSYLRNLQLSEADVRFMNNLRYFRNGIKYYGKTFDKQSAERVLSFLNKIYPNLRELVTKK